MRACGEAARDRPRDLAGDWRLGAWLAYWAAVAECDEFGVTIQLTRSRPTNCATPRQRVSRWLGSPGQQMERAVADVVGSVERRCDDGQGGHGQTDVQDSDQDRRVGPEQPHADVPCCCGRTVQPTGARAGASSRHGGRLQEATAGPAPG
ncbi:hypothetical protein IW249_005171 [Micromonospora vinacea]|uniref:Uncharacterized protein n=1 Tax=Micromonospora vinacea TaxID=709878 RepID=A0ABS0K9Y0_9ACTN|nr:hypothetical protein [Micromonospora vinacea]